MVSELIFYVMSLFMGKNILNSVRICVSEISADGTTGIENTFGVNKVLN